MTEGLYSKMLHTDVLWQRVAGQLSIFCWHVLWGKERGILYDSRHIEPLFLLWWPPSTSEFRTGAFLPMERDTFSVVVGYVNRHSYHNYLWTNRPGKQRKNYNTRKHITNHWRLGNKSKLLLQNDMIVIFIELTRYEVYDTIIYDMILSYHTAW